MQTDTLTGGHTMTTYTQKDILKCDYVGDYKFYIQTYHSTGMPWSEENCPRFRYKMDAEEWVRLSKNEGGK